MIENTRILENVYILKDCAGCCANLVTGREKAHEFTDRMIIHELELARGDRR